MTQPGDGIDLSKSGWTNPEGFTRDPRPSTPTPPAPRVCGDIGPDGWECDYPPNHKPRGKHWADNGEPGGIVWERSIHDASTMADLALPEDQRPFVQGGIVATRPGIELMEGEPVLHARRMENLSATDRFTISTLVERGLASTNPGQWYAALDKIQEVLHG